MFGMVILPFLCNGLLHYQFNLPRVKPVLTLSSEQVHSYLASSLVPDFNKIFYFL